MRAQCEKYNRNCFNELCSKIKDESYEFQAQDTLIQGTVQITAENAFLFVPDDDSDAGGLVKHLPLVKGCRVMLIRNISCNDGLVNGAQGIVVGFQFDGSSNEVNKIEGILVKFDDPKIGQLYSNSQEHEPILIRKMSVTYYGKQNIVFSRTQFPLVLCYASTVHKVQGLTLDHAVVDIGDSIFQSAQAYVALSRVRTLSGLALLAFSRKKVMASSKVHSEMQRLIALLDA